MAQAYIQNAGPNTAVEPLSEVFGQHTSPEIANVQSQMYAMGEVHDNTMPADSTFLSDPMFQIIREEVSGGTLSLIMLLLRFSDHCNSITR